MTEKSQIQSLIKEAELYQKQGLLNESKEKFKEILDTVLKDEDLSNDRELVELIQSKTGEVAADLEEVESDTGVVELSDEVQGLIGKLFSFSKNADTAAVESAVALATFGQHKKALSEFQRLLDNGILPMDVAKNMLQCHLSLGKHEDAVSQFEAWISEGTFSGGDLGRLRDFLQDILGRDGIEVDLPYVEDTESGEEAMPAVEVGTPKQDVPELLSIRLISSDKDPKKRLRDFDVRFQLGSSVTIDIERSDGDLLTLLKPGAHLSKIQCYTSYYLFIASGTVSGRDEVIAGPKKGDYSIVISLNHP
jgi:tetratricopeptide (TPR) repeat protein